MLPAPWAHVQLLEYQGGLGVGASASGSGGSAPAGHNSPSTLRQRSQRQRRLQQAQGPAQAQPAEEEAQQGLSRPLAERRPSLESATLQDVLRAAAPLQPLQQQQQPEENKKASLAETLAVLMGHTAFGRQPGAVGAWQPWPWEGVLATLREAAPLAGSVAQRGRSAKGDTCSVPWGAGLSQC